jgi:3-amino-5-hydroxybenzoate synthase
MTLAMHGGTPVRTRPFPEWPQYDDGERAALIRALEQGAWWRAAGTEVTSFEEEFAAFHEAPAALAVTNGTHAIELALDLAGIGAGDEVVVPAFTFISTSTAVQRVGAVPVPADVLPDTYCLDPAALDAVTTPRTRAVLPVHMAGEIADMDAIGEWATRNAVTVVHDAAHAPGARWRGQPLGAFGHTACFSFQNGKLMTAGEGGAVLLPDPALYDEAFSRHSCGRPRGDRVYVHRTASPNLRMTEFSGAVLREQLKRLPSQIAVREEAWTALAAALSALPGVVPQGHDPRTTTNPRYMAMFVLDPGVHGALDRNAVVDALVAEGIPAFVAFPAVYRTGAFWDGVTTGLPPRDELAARCPVSETVASRGIWVHHRVLLGGPDAVRDVAAAVGKVVEELPVRTP